MKETQFSDLMSFKIFGLYFTILINAVTICWTCYEYILRFCQWSFQALFLSTSEKSSHSICGTLRVVFFEIDLRIFWNQKIFFQRGLRERIFF